MSYLHDTLTHLKACRGRSCILPRASRASQLASNNNAPNSDTTNNSVTFQRGSNRKKNNLIGE